MYQKGVFISPLVSVDNVGGGGGQLWIYCSIYKEISVR